MTSSCPVGLQHLISASEIKIRQLPSGLKGNKFEILTVEGEVILKTKEDGDLLSFMAGSERSFRMDIYDMQKKMVCSLRRPYTFDANKMEVTVNREVVAIVREKPTFLKPVLFINDAKDSQVLRLKGDPKGGSKSLFELQTSSKTGIGYIRRKWGGFLKEIFSDRDTYLVKFPGDLDVRFKLAVIGSCLLIDYMYHES